MLNLTAAELEADLPTLTKLYRAAEKAAIKRVKRTNTVVRDLHVEALQARLLELQAQAQGVTLVMDSDDAGHTVTLTVGYHSTTRRFATEAEARKRAGLTKGTLDGFTFNGCALDGFAKATAVLQG